MQQTIAEITVQDLLELETQLDSAVKNAIHAALVEGQHGVLVTRYDSCRFTVTLSLEVPFGITRELDLR